MAKDEADVIAQTLKSATAWCDYIYVYDNGSTDNSWEQVLELAEQYPSQIIPYKKDDAVFRGSLRGEVFRYYRSKSQPGDWWCRLDADEFYIDNPRIFLAKIPEHYKMVWSASFQYYFTDIDLAQYKQNPELYADSVPVETKLRYYRNNWSERRFFRDEANLQWEEDNAWPSASLAGEPYPVRIWLKHFQYRSPRQIQGRLSTRTVNVVNQDFSHEMQNDWKSKILDPTKLSRQDQVETFQDSWESRILEASALDYDAHDRRYVVNEHLMPQIKSLQTPKPPSFMERIKNAIAKVLQTGQSSGFYE
ncbi:Glycosyl transferase [Tumidithrix helvetica PCC 7403]|uniref:glycosyltransferase family 2 protein n=1 Tax=Tumidithrix helvetica TaxID=3457545 RepID=UPI003C805EC1